jgi:hypothetical protein
MNRLSVLNRGSEWIAGQKGVHAFFSGLSGNDEVQSQPTW